MKSVQRLRLFHCYTNYHARVTTQCRHSVLMSIKQYPDKLISTFPTTTPLTQQHTKCIKMSIKPEYVRSLIKIKQYSHNSNWLFSTTTPLVQQQQPSAPPHPLPPPPYHCRRRRHRHRHRRRWFAGDRRPCRVTRRSLFSWQSRSSDDLWHTASSMLSSDTMVRSLQQTSRPFPCHISQYKLNISLCNREMIILCITTPTNLYV